MDEAVTTELTGYTGDITVLYNLDGLKKALQYVADIFMKACNAKENSIIISTIEAHKYDMYVHIGGVFKNKNNLDKVMLGGLYMYYGEIATKCIKITKDNILDLRTPVNNEEWLAFYKYMINCIKRWFDAEVKYAKKWS